MTSNVVPAGPLSTRRARPIELAGGEATTADPAAEPGRLMQFGAASISKRTPVGAQRFHDGRNPRHIALANRVSVPARRAGVERVRIA